MKFLRRMLVGKKEGRKLSFLDKHFSSLHEILPEDIFIAGYPKSGNSWFQNLIAGLVFGILPDRGHPRLVLEVIPDVHQKNVLFRRYQTPSFFKTHHKPMPQYQNVVYLLRDGRDVMVSYWHFLQAIQNVKIDFATMVQTGEHLYPCKWQEHVETWMANPYNARMLVIKYEDLLCDPIPQLKRFCAFSGIEADTGFLEMISHSATFEKLQEKERRLWVPDSGWPKDKQFYRRGVEGSFRDEMPDDVLQAFLKEAGDTLKQQGYPV